MIERLKASLFALFQAAVPRLDYYAKYDGEVVKWWPRAAGEKYDSVDIKPSDARLPSMARIPFKGGPGEELDIAPGTHVLVGWENGDPARPCAFSWSGGEHVIKRVINADDLALGGEAGAEHTIKADTYRSAEDLYLDAIVTGVQAALSSLSLTPAATALTAAQNAFKASKAGYVTTNVRVK